MVDWLGKAKQAGREKQTEYKVVWSPVRKLCLTDPAPHRRRRRFYVTGSGGLCAHAPTLWYIQYLAKNVSPIVPPPKKKIIVQLPT
jgi:hypothetical protein